MSNKWILQTDDGWGQPRWYDENGELLLGVTDNGDLYVDKAVWDMAKNYQASQAVVEAAKTFVEGDWVPSHTYDELKQALEALPKQQ
jgi:hypothetical protein